MNVLFVAIAQSCLRVLDHVDSLSLHFRAHSSIGQVEVLYNEGKLLGCTLRYVGSILHCSLLHNHLIVFWSEAWAAEVAASAPREDTCVTARRVPSWPSVHL